MEMSSHGPHSRGKPTTQGTASDANMPDISRVLSRGNPLAETIQDEATWEKAYDVSMVPTAPRVDPYKIHIETKRPSEK